MSVPNIVLTGFMGTGKSTVGKLIAEKTGRLFVDTDDLIMDQTGMTISELFSKSGEDTFRQLERKICRELENAENMVISSGGRMLLDPLNALWLSSRGLIFCLTATPAEINARLGSGDDRPLLAVNEREVEISRLLSERADGYGQFNQVSTSRKTPEQVVSELLHLTEDLIRQRQWPQYLKSRLEIQHPNGRYPIYVGQNLLPSLTQHLSLEEPFIVITDDQVGPLFANRIGPGKPSIIITIPAGEQSKNLQSIVPLYERLLEAGLDRSGTIVALGGGVIGDMAGFVAATYMRGVKLVNCPTTLLAMVDASIGGKTGVDLPQGKNLVGAFKQPAAVVSDLNTLSTLPDDEFRSGLAEIIKHGIMASPALLDRIRLGYGMAPAEKHRNQFQATVLEAIEIKKMIVQTDPFEQGIRAHLNLGHTFAHAVETLSGYQIKHGYAVAMGLVCAASLSVDLGFCHPNVYYEIKNLLKEVGLPSAIPVEFSPQEIYQVMQRDKKRKLGKVNLVLIRAIGELFVTDAAPAEAVVAAISKVQEKEVAG